MNQSILKPVLTAEDVICLGSLYISYNPLALLPPFLWTRGDVMELWFEFTDQIYVKILHSMTLTTYPKLHELSFQDRNGYI